MFFYTLGEQLKIDTIHDYAEKLGLVGQDRHRSAGRESTASSPSTEWKQRDVQAAVVSGRDDLGRDRSGRRVRDADRAGDDDLDGRERRHAGHAAPRARGRCRTARAGSRCPRRRRARQVPLQPGRSAGGARRPLDGRQRHRHRRRRADRRARTCPARPARRRSSRSRARRSRAGKMDVRDHGCFVFFAPRDNPQIAGVVFAEHGVHGSAAAPIAKHVMETFFAKQEGRPLPRAAGDRRHRARPAARPAASCRPTDRTPRPRARPMIVERRLSAHLDWPLLAAVVALTVHRPGHDLSSGHGPASRARSSGRSSTRCRSASRRWSACLVDRLPDARAAVAHLLRACSSPR